MREAIDKGVAGTWAPMAVIHAFTVAASVRREYLGNHRNEHDHENDHEAAQDAE